METQRRIKGSGSVSLRPDGRWMGQAAIPSPDGKRRRITTYGKTAEEAEEKLRAKLPRLAADTREYATPRYERLLEARRLGRHTAGEWYAKVRDYDNRCHYCQRFTRRITKDHLTPITRGGSDAIDNIVPCCRPCNSEKSNLTADEFLSSRSSRG